MLGRALGLALLLFLRGGALLPSAEDAGGLRPKLDEMIGELIPEDGPVRPPFELARFDLGLKPDPKNIPELANQALRRQEDQALRWSAIKRLLERAGNLQSGTQGRVAILRYAFGELPLDEARKAAQPAGRPERLLLARLLLAECRYPEAVGELAALADGEDNLGRQALALLVRLDMERQALGKHVPVVPMKFDLSAWLKRRAEQDQQTAALMEGLRKAVHPVVARARRDIRQAVSSAGADIVVPPDILRDAVLGDHFEGLEVLAETRQGKQLPLFLRIEQPFIQTDPQGFELQAAYTDAPGILDKARFTLRSDYHGDIGFALFALESDEQWHKLSAEDLGKLEPRRTWTRAHGELGQNNRPVQNQMPVEVDNLGPGYYLLAAEARYCPIVAAVKFAVSHRSVYLRASRNQALAAVVDRRTGAPLAEQAVELRVHAIADDLTLLSGEDLEFTDSFRHGFFGQDLNGPPARLPAMQHVEQAAEYARGMELRKEYPDTEQTLKAVTGADGLALFAVDLGRKGYAYDLVLTSPGPDAAGARLHYDERGRHVREGNNLLGVVVWSAQPIYRPGERVYLKGVVRRFEDKRCLPHNAAWKKDVQVEVRNSKETVWQGLCPLSEAGAFKAEFTLAKEVELDHYSVWVEGLQTEPYAPFTVEEFRRPTFEVKLTSEQNNYAGGSQAACMVKVNYLTGNPATGAEVEVLTEANDLEPMRLALTTDKDGLAKFELPLPVVASNRYLEVRAHVMDLSGETYTSSMRLHVLRNAFDLKVEAAPDPAVEGSRVELLATALDWAGKPLAGVQAAVSGETRSRRTDEQGVARLATTAGRGKEQWLRVTALRGEDVVERSVRIRLLPQPENGAQAKPDQIAHRDDVKINAAKQVNEGQELPVELEVDSAGGGEATVLLCAEHVRALAHKLLRLPPGKHTVCFATDAEYAPAVHVTAVLLAGRRILQHACSARVMPVSRFLTLEVKPDREDYRPGALCRVDLRALDTAGQPVAGAEISLGVVDTALYALREDPTPDFLMFYYRRALPLLASGAFDSAGTDLTAFRFFKAPKYAWGYPSDEFDQFMYERFEGLSAGEGHGSFGYRSGGGRRVMVMRHGGSMATGSDPPTRKDFRTLAHWVADLKTGADGRAKAEFKLPDTITGWRFTARGITADTRVGEVRVERSTQLPLQVELALPRALRAGDEVLAGAVARNNTPAERQVELRYGGQAGEGAKELKLSPLGGGRLDIPLAPKAAGPITLQAQVKDRDGKDADAMEREWPVLPAGYFTARDAVGELAGGGEITLDLGGPLHEGTLAVRVNIEPGMLGPVTTALDRLIEYPYGCVEQTMSRFMPAVVAAQAIRKAGLPALREKDLPEVIARSLARLAAYQHGDGGWGWWAQDASNDFMCAYVLEGLCLARDAGTRVPAGMLDRAERYLSERFHGNQLTPGAVGGIGDVALKPYAARALALYYASDERFAPQRERVLNVLGDPPRAQDFGVRSTAVWADALRLLGKPEAARVLLAEARAALEFGPADRGTLLALGALLEAGGALEGALKDAPALCMRAAQGRRGQLWVDTLTTAWVVRGLARFLAPAAAGSGEVELLADGKSVARLTPDRQRRVEAHLGRELAGATTLALRPAGAVPAGYFWTVHVEGYRKERPLPPAAPRALVTLSVAEGEGGWILPDADGSLGVPRGKTLRVRLTCQLESDLVCARLSFPRPCGVEFLRGVRLEKGLVAAEERDDRITFFVDRWEKGEHSIELLARAEAAGRVFAPLPELEPMYGAPLPVRYDAPEWWKVKE